MNKKKFFVLLVVLSLAALGFYSTVRAAETGLVYHEIQVFDELGEKVTSITSFDIYLVGTTTNPTIYQDAAKTTAITLPMTTSSTNTTLSNGYCYWWGPSGWDFSITDGTNVATNANHRDRTPSDGRLVFPSYLSSISSTTYTDAQSATFGTSSDWVLSAGATADKFTAIPATTSTSRFDIGNANYTADFNLFGDGGYHMGWDASAYSLELADTTRLSIGTGDDLIFVSNGTLVTATGNLALSGELDINATYDVLLDSTYDVAWDASRYTLLFQDSAILGLGGAHDAAADVGIAWNGANLLIEAATDNTGQIQLGATNSMDLVVYGSTTTDIALFDASAGALLLDSYPIALGDGDAILFGDTLGTGDFTLSDATDVLTFDVVVAGVGEMAIGNDADDVPLKWYGETAGDYIYFTGDTLTFEDCTPKLQDDTSLVFGDDSDGTLQYDEDGFDAMQWNNIAVFGAKILMDETHTGSPEIITAAQSGKTFLGSEILHFMLPAAAAGLHYYFVDLDPAATEDLTIICAAGDAFESGGSMGTITQTADFGLPVCHVFATTSASWTVELGTPGTWDFD